MESKYEHTLEEPLIVQETAKLARKAGFKIETLWYFDSVNADIADEKDNWNQYEDMYSAPTQALLQKWLREEYNIQVQTAYEKGFWCYILYQLPSTEDIKFAASGECQDGDLWLDADMVNKEWYLQEQKSYEEALENGLQEALRLDGITKNKL